MAFAFVARPCLVGRRSKASATHAGIFLGIEPTQRRIEWDSVDMVKPEPDGRIAWRFNLNDWEGVRRQLLGEPADPETPVYYAIQAPPGHPLARLPA